jgi:transcriptional regulator GlxA family with amidase domain
LVMSSAGSAWQDLLLYLLNRYAGPEATQALARHLMLPRHVERRTPCIAFVPPKNHEDGLVLQMQDWIEENLTVASPVEAMARQAGLAERTLNRRFKEATGYTPIEYVQELRVERARRLLERTDLPIEEIGWTIGYEDAAFFRRLFKRITDMSPGRYRRRFRVPDLARVA